MILLLGGTSESTQIARALAEAGVSLLFSKATTAPLAVPEHARVETRTGALDAEAMSRLARKRHVLAIVDVTHPYAVVATETAVAVARAEGIPFFQYLRPSCGTSDKANVVRADDHVAAARLAAESGEPILLTIGTRNLASYIGPARQAGAALFARVLPEPSPLESCGKAGLSERFVIAARGPFSTERNRQDIRRCGIRVLVTKDSGAAGGVPEKIEAAQLEGCRVVLVERPGAHGVDADRVYASLDALVRAVLDAVCPDP